MQSRRAFEPAAAAAASKVRQTVPQTQALARLPALQGRYLSKRPRLLSQLRNPLLFVGKPTGEQLETVDNLKAEVKRTMLEEKVHHLISNDDIETFFCQ